MLEKYLEPDVTDYRCECGDCESCINDWEWGDCEDLNDDERAIRIAEFNYECQVYNEMDKQILVF